MALWVKWPCVVFEGPEFVGQPDHVKLLAWGLEAFCKKNGTDGWLGTITPSDAKRMSTTTASLAKVAEGIEHLLKIGWLAKNDAGEHFLPTYPVRQGPDTEAERAAEKRRKAELKNSFGSHNRVTKRDTHKPRNVTPPGPDLREKQKKISAVSLEGEGLETAIGQLAEADRLQAQSLLRDGKASEAIAFIASVRGAA